MAPSGVNNVQREVMAASKREWNRSHPTVTAGGSANALTLSYAVNPTALVQGQMYSFIASATNTGPATLQVGALAATALQVNRVALAGGEIVAGNIVTVIYTGSVYALVTPVAAGSANSAQPWGRNVLINPNFERAQRIGETSGNTLGVAASSPGVYGHDRWYL